MKRLLAAALLSVCLITTACNDFERTAFQTLSASKAVIDNAQAQYEARTIPHNQCVYDVINKAKDTQTLAVNAMLVYETSKTGGAQAAVETELVQLPNVLAGVQGLSTGACK